MMRWREIRAQDKKDRQVRKNERVMVRRDYSEMSGRTTYKCSRRNKVIPGVRQECCVEVEWAQVRPKKL